MVSPVTFFSRPAGNLAIAIVPPSLALLVGIVSPVKTFLLWPNRGALPGVLGFSDNLGKLQGDLYTQASLEGPQVIPSYLASVIIPGHLLTVVEWFDFISWLVWILLIALFSILMWQFFLLVRSTNRVKPPPIPRAFGIFGTSCVVAAAGVFLPAHFLFFGSPLGVWRAIELVGLKGSGVAQTLIVVSLLSFLAVESTTLKVWPWRLLLRLVPFFLAACAGFVHPTSPVYILAWAAVLYALSCPGRFLSKVRTLAIPISGYASGALAHVLLFSEFRGVSGTALRIYLEAHYYHYLPDSFPIGDYVGFAATVAIGFALIWFASKFLQIPRIRLFSIFAICIAIALAGLGLQILGVSSTMFESLALLGPVRVAPVYNLGFGFIVLMIFFEVVSQKAPWIARAFPSATALTISGLLVVSLTASFLARDVQVSYSQQTFRLERFETAIEMKLVDVSVLPISDSPSSTFFWREIAGSNVFVDDYFPFSDGAISEWGERRAVAMELKTCLGAGAGDCLNSFRELDTGVQVIFVGGEMKFACEDIEESSGFACVKVDETVLLVVK